jgi:hypothetical protein
MMLGKNIVDLMNSNEALGILTSDGLTTLDTSATILGAGEIIDLSGPGAGAVTGGGRTHAAVAASRFGLSIKISEDGPISVYADGRELLRFVR